MRPDVSNATACSRDGSVVRLEALIPVEGVLPVEAGIVEPVLRLEVVTLPVAGDPLPDQRPLHVGAPEVDPGVHAGVDDLLDPLREAREAPRGAGGHAGGAERDAIGAEEVAQRVR